ncbi:MAG: alpha/beta fold hydrolase [Ktedonobacteraceae bacterium]
MKDNTLISASDDSNYQEQHVNVWGGAVQLKGVLSIPEGAHALGVINYVQTDYSELTPDVLHNLAVTNWRAGIATLLVNLLTLEDEALDHKTRFFRENVEVLHQRIIGIANWVINNDETHSLSIGCFGTGVSAAAVLAATARRPDAIHAVVAVDPRTDLVRSYLPRVVMPTLFIAGERDMQSLDMSLKAIAELTTDSTLDIVREARERGLPHALEAIPDVTNVFENEESVQQVGRLAARWFALYL